eukprot:4839265-Amphidinium_carterae.2
MSCGFCLGVVDFELPLSDPRCRYDEETVNNGSIELRQLNHSPGTLEAVLLTSFDLVDDVDVGNVQ